MDFLYDESGSAYSFIYNGTQYYYVKNLQGDVMRIVDATGAVVANYTYDAWGKVTNSGNIVGLYNPIRYRGYYYDTDTGFYYLQSRYYDPVVKRFINANGNFFKLNLYVYCENNPVMYKKSIYSIDNSITESSISSLASGGIYDSLCSSLNTVISKNTTGFGKVTWENKWFDTDWPGFLVLSNEGFELVNWSLSIYKGSLYFNNNENHSIHISGGNASIYAGINYKEGLGLSASANVAEINYDGRFIDASIEGLSVGFTYMYKNGKFQFKNGYVWWGWSVSIDFLELFGGE